jgi:DNA repair photolyase
MGTGRFAPPPGESVDYRQGYLCGMIRGDGTLGSYRYARDRGGVSKVHRFRLALCDFEALRRARKYLEGFAVATDEFVFKAAAKGRRGISAIRTQRRNEVAMVRELIAWPHIASEDWCKGFLAGIFDAEGSFSGSLRISNCDEVIIDWIAYCLRRFGFSFAQETQVRARPITCVRLTGGLPEVLRFFHTVEPAITRKRSIEGIAVKTNARLQVRSIEPLGFEMPMYDITTGTGDFIGNGVINHNCFARSTHVYLDLDAGRDFEREIIVKINAPEVLRAELARRRWKRELVAIGTNTDPYQWVESRYRMMPPVLEALHEAATPVSVLTKSPLVLRDIEHYAEMAAAAGATVNLSIPTLDERVWRQTEPHTPHPRARMEAVAELNRRGIGSGVLVMPLMPGINDAPEQVEPLVELAREAGASFVASNGLHLRGEVKDVFFGWLESQRPDLLQRYRELYKGRRAYLPSGEQKRLRSLVKGWGGNARRSRRPVPPPEPAGEQQARLF